MGKGIASLKLEFDRGTVVFGGTRDQAPKGAPLAALPGVLWDPRVRCNRAPAYRYRELRAALSEQGVPVEDHVLELPRRAASLEVPTLRPYQCGAVASHLENGRRGTVVMPTGAGKTHVAMAVMAGARSSLCLVPTRALLHQWRQRLLEAGAEAVGVVGDGRREVLPITVTTFESAYRHMAILGNRFELLVVDESHHFGIGARDEALEMCAAPYRLGLTATPPALPYMERLAVLLGPIVFQQALSDLKGSFLADFEIVVMKLPLTANEQQRYQDDYTVFAQAYRDFSTCFPGRDFGAFAAAAQAHSEGRRALAAFYRSRELLALTEAKRRIVSELLLRHRDSRVMVFTSANAAAYRLATEHLLAPITCDIGSKERQQILASFAAGEIHAVVSARVLNEGIDVPDADVALIVGGSQGEREHVQRVGRLLRPRPGKRAVVYELISAVGAEERRGRARRRALIAVPNPTLPGSALPSAVGTDASAPPPRTLTLSEA